MDPTVAHSTLRRVTGIDAATPTTEPDDDVGAAHTEPSVEMDATTVDAAEPTRSAGHGLDAA